MESSTVREVFEEIQPLSDDPATRAAAISREIHLLIISIENWMQERMGNKREKQGLFSICIKNNTELKQLQT